MAITTVKNVKKWLIFAVIILIFTVAGLIITKITSKEYEAHTTLLVTQKNAEFDAYIALRSADRVAYSLAQVLGSAVFRQDVFLADDTIDQHWLPLTEEEKNKFWRDQVEARAVKEAGILEVSVFHTDARQAQKIAQAINFILMNKNADYHGGGAAVTIKVINPPVLPTAIARPNLIVNVGGGAILGALVALAYLTLATFEAKKEEAPEASESTTDETAALIPDSITTKTVAVMTSETEPEKVASEDLVANYFF